MKIIDRYTLKQVFVGFILVLLSMTVLVWLTQSLRLLNMIVKNGASMGMFLKLTLLVLPKFLQFLSPLALFAVALFTLIRMQADKELMVMQAVGMSAKQIIRPIFILGIILTILGYGLSIFIIPAATIEFKEMRWKIKNDLSHVLLQEGQFNTVEKGLTVYVKERLTNGRVKGIFAYDTKNPKQSDVYAAGDGILYQSPDGIKIELHQGIKQTYRPDTKQFSIWKFEKQTMMLGDNSKSKNHRLGVSELPLWTLLTATKAELNNDVDTWRKYKVEFVKRLIQPLYNLSFLFLVIFGVLSGYYNRRGQVGRINLTVGLALLVQSTALTFEYLANKNLWFVILLVLNVFLPVVIAYPHLLKKFKWAKRLGISMLLLAAMPTFAATLKMSSVDKNAPVDFEADDVSYNQKSGKMDVRGNVVLKQDTLTLKTEKLTYDKKNDLIQIPNKMRLKKTDGTVMISENAQTNGHLTQMAFGKTNVRLYEGTRLGASELKREPDGNSYLKDVTYTPCDVCEGKSPLWQLKSKSVWHDFEAKDMIYKHSLLEVKDVPVFYFPYLRMPDFSVKRRSGFLSPKIYSTHEMRNSVELPYFFNLADNQNLTITPVFSLEHTPLMKGSYEGLYTQGFFNMKASGTKDEDNGKHKQGHIWADMRYDMTDKWRITGQLYKVSSDTYFRKYKLEGIDDTESFLESNLAVERFGNRNYFRVKSYSFQSLQSKVESDSIPVILPTMDFKYNTMPLNGMGVYAYSEINSAVYNTREHFKSDRLSLTQGVFMPYVSTMGLAVDMRGYVRMDGYHVDTGLADVSGMTKNREYDTSRFYPNLSATMRYPFVKNTPDSIQTIEPIAMIVASNNGGNKDEIPNVDSLAFDFDDTDLFSTNRFYGYDRVEPGTRVNYGLKWSHIYLESKHSLSAMVGQSYRFDDDELMTELMGYKNHTSNYVGRFQFSMPYFTAYYRARLDQDNFKAHKNEIGTTIGDNPFKVGLSYVKKDAYKMGNYTYKASEEITYRASSKLTKSLNVSGFYQYDLSQDGGPVKTGGTIRYDNECTALIFEIEKSYTEDRDYKGGMSFMAKLVLKTLGGI